MKKVWIFNHYATNTYLNKGGRHYWLAEILIKKGFKPTIFCANTLHNSKNIISTESSEYKKIIRDEIPYVFVKTPKYEGNKIKRIINILAFYINIQKIMKNYLENNEKPDVIYASSVHPLTLVAGIKIAKKLNIPCISEVRDLWPESLIAYKIIKRNGIIAKILYKGEKWIYKNSNQIVMTWEGGKDYIFDRKWEKDIDIKKINYISNGVLLEDFDTNLEKYKTDAIETGNYNFVYAGSIRKVNNLELLIDAAKIIQKKGYHDIKIVIYGDGNEKKMLEDKCDNENINNVYFKGNVRKQEIPYILTQSYMNILHNTSTSLDKYGQSQNKLYEYLASGRPILQTYNSKFNVILKYNCGIVNEKQNSYQIADSIINAYKNPIDIREKGINARKAAYLYDFNILTEKMIEIILKANIKGDSYESNTYKL
ncbi:glycosyltransferase family 4 protein [Staphylococcus hominis]|uniref:Glycosyltransferase family 4 protein n=1 Tax=Staphylococcus hominis TaxID=1290 RepID=A0A8X8GQ72_STAHO|nr:glycosyltransferase family 4 protein [Staphylococcus hominis]MBK1407224.1 glycosyltransferase family 4 protein [Staphylococcus hominis]MCM5673268.1 glycosyltransferase family 4 protein [Staphylococcus hominis]PNZ81213.1 glycosyltransferase WbuB [Staphylococcus hominis subsp. novobiosepticus]